MWSAQLPDLTGRLTQGVDRKRRPRHGDADRWLGVEIHTVGSILLIVGIAGVIASLLLLLWSSRARNDWYGRGTPTGDVPPGPA